MATSVSHASVHVEGHGDVQSYVAGGRIVVSIMDEQSCRNVATLHLSREAAEEVYKQIGRALGALTGKEPTP